MPLPEKTERTMPNVQKENNLRSEKNEKKTKSKKKTDDEPYAATITIVPLSERRGKNDAWRPSTSERDYDTKLRKNEDGRSDDVLSSKGGQKKKKSKGAVFWGGKGVGEAAWMECLGFVEVLQKENNFEVLDLWGC